MKQCLCPFPDLPHSGDWAYHGNEQRFRLPGPQFTMKTLYVFVPHRRARL